MKNDQEETETKRHNIHIVHIKQIRNNSKTDLRAV